MADEKIPKIKSFSPDKVHPGATLIIDGENLDLVKKVKIHDKWASFSLDKGKLKVTIPDCGVGLLLVSLGYGGGFVNNRQCGLQPLRNMVGEKIEAAPAPQPAPAP